MPVALLCSTSFDFRNTLQGQHLFHILTTTIAPPAQDSAMAAALIVEVQGWLVSEDGWHCATNCAAPVGVQAAECNSTENE